MVSTLKKFVTERYTTWRPRVNITYCCGWLFMLICDIVLAAVALFAVCIAYTSSLFAYYFLHGQMSFWGYGMPADREWDRMVQGAEKSGLTPLGAKAWLILSLIVAWLIVSVFDFFLSRVAARIIDLVGLRPAVDQLKRDIKQRLDRLIPTRREHAPDAL